MDLLDEFPNEPDTNVEDVSRFRLPAVIVVLFTLFAGSLLAFFATSPKPTQIAAPRVTAVVTVTETISMPPPQPTVVVPTPPPATMPEASPSTTALPSPTTTTPTPPPVAPTSTRPTAPAPTVTTPAAVKPAQPQVSTVNLTCAWEPQQNSLVAYFAWTGPALPAKVTVAGKTTLNLAGATTMRATGPTGVKTGTCVATVGDITRNLTVR